MTCPTGQQRPPEKLSSMSHAAGQRKGCKPKSAKCQPHFRNNREFLRFMSID
jgi:hypothetical protein